MVGAFFALSSAFAGNANQKQKELNIREGGKGAGLLKDKQGKGNPRHGNNAPGNNGNNRSVIFLMVSGSTRSLLALSSFFRTDL